jgi:micrococcal nuclease
MCFGKHAYYDAQTIDKYGRTVAVVNCGGVEVNRAQVERGMAWVYTKYNNDLPLLAIESQAKQSRKGLWADKSPTPPWEFRHPTKKVSATNGDSTCHVGPRGGRYEIVNGHKRYGC